MICWMMISEPMDNNNYCRCWNVERRYPEVQADASKHPFSLFSPQVQCSQTNLVVVYLLSIES